MLIRTASASELKVLWGNNNLPTQAHFMKGIEDGEIEFWTVEEGRNNRLVGELYIFWDSTDKDEADGKNRAYLCAFRINDEFQGLGLGSNLMKRVLQRIVEKDYCEVTIGVESDDERLIKMYNAWGFIDLIKLQNIDLHNIDIHGNAQPVSIPTALYLKSLKDL
jgi:ribosomal protein S18 acetylase RimI-like enzyme